MEACYDYFCLPPQDARALTVPPPPLRIPWRSTCPHRALTVPPPPPQDAVAFNVLLAEQSLASMVTQMSYMLAKTPAEVGVGGHAPEV